MSAFASAGTTSYDAVIYISVREILTAQHQSGIFSSNGKLYLHSPDALAKAHERFGGSQGLLRSASQCLADAERSIDSKGPGQSGYNEIPALSNFIVEAGLCMDPEAVHALLESEQRRMRGGNEHRVALLHEEGRVMKVGNAQALATESLYDYLTDLLLSNYYFDDDLQILGCCTFEGQLYLVSSQPYIDGPHPGWPELKEGLLRLGLRDPCPGSLGGTFIIDDETLGEINVFDLHVNNVIRGSDGRLNVIDAHFYFDDRASRIAAVQALGLDAVSGPTELASSELSQKSL